MQADMLRGELVRLQVESPQVLAEHMTAWLPESQYWRLMSSDPHRLWSKKKTLEWLEKKLERYTNDNPASLYNFGIRTLGDERLIGDIGLGEISWTSGEAWAGIGIGRPADWGKGFGTDAMRVLLAFAFDELNLQRVSLNVFSYNPRAIRSYEKAGFEVEGREREFLQRDGQRWDLVYLGILRGDWAKGLESGLSLGRRSKNDVLHGE